MEAGPDYSSILRAFRRGEEAALRQLYKWHYRPLCDFADRILHNSAEAEDVVVDVFVKLLGKKEDFHDLNSIKSFLFTAVRNACIDRWRKKQRIGATSAIPQWLEAPDQEVLQREMLMARVLQTIYEEIENLPPQCRRVFIALFLEGKSTAQAAAQLGISPQTVLNQKSKAIRLLRVALYNKGLYCPVLLACIVSLP